MPRARRGHVVQGHGWPALSRDCTDALVADVALGVGAACAIGGVVTLLVPLDVRIGVGTVTLGGSF